MEQAKVFHALGDTHRLALLERLTDGTPHTLTTLTDELHMSRQGARKHVQILEDAGLVVIHTKGRSTLVSLNVKTVHQSQRFLAELEAAWAKRLASLKSYLEQGTQL